MALVCVVSGALIGCGKQTGNVRLTILDEVTGAPVSGAAVMVGSMPGRSDQRGVANLSLSEGGYDLSVEHRAYHTRFSSVTVFNGGLAMKTISLRPRPEGSLPSPSPGASPTPIPGPSPTLAPGYPSARVSGVVRDQQGHDVDGVEVRAEVIGRRYAFKATTVARGGHYALEVPTGLRLRFTAGGGSYGLSTFTTTLPANAGPGPLPALNFNHAHALPRPGMTVSGIF